MPRPTRRRQDWKHRREAISMSLELRGAASCRCRAVWPMTACGCGAACRALSRRRGLLRIAEWCEERFEFDAKPALLGSTFSRSLAPFRMRQSCPPAGGSGDIVEAVQQAMARKSSTWNSISSPRLSVIEHTGGRRQLVAFPGRPQAKRVRSSLVEHDRSIPFLKQLLKKMSANWRRGSHGTRTAPVPGSVLATRATAEVASRHQDAGASVAG